jgi:hypothetical protein
MIRRCVGRLAVLAALVLSGCVVHPSVEIKPFNGAAAEPNAVVHYADFWDAIDHWDVSYIRDHQVSDEQRRYAEALDALDRADVGSLAIRSHPVLVLPKEDVLTRSFRIDGVLGIPAIRAMDIQIDYDTSMVTIRKPEPRKDVRPNLLPSADLMLRVRTPDGIPALMMFDTGSFITFVYKTSLHYLGLKSNGRARYTAATFGSKKSSVVGVVPTMSLVLDSTQIQWTNVIAAPDIYEEPVPILSPMGVLGTDIFQQGGHARIDWTNRHIDFWWDGINTAERQGDDL